MNKTLSSSLRLQPPLIALRLEKYPAGVSDRKRLYSQPIYQVVRQKIYPSYLEAPICHLRKGKGTGAEMHPAIDLFTDTAAILNY